MKNIKLTYKKAGVDVIKADKIVSGIKTIAKSTKTKGALSDIGSFGALFAVNAKKYKNPVLVSSTDGVGTKLMIAHELNKHDTVGIDLVAMSANDVATTGAKPLFLLDYIATGKIEQNVLKDIIKGISKACRETGYALIGGETAEMPDMYEKGVYDLAAFCVGIIDKKDIINGKNTKQGDAALGIESSGTHSNGYSLVRKVFNKNQRRKYANQLLKPTRLYVKPLLQLQEKIKIKGIAHITGGAYFSKLPRIVPKNLKIVVDKKSWPRPQIFKLLQQKGNISEKEMYRTFNMGIGMVVVISPKDIKTAQKELRKFGMRSWVIGKVVKGKGEVELK